MAKGSGGDWVSGVVIAHLTVRNHVAFKVDWEMVIVEVQMMTAEFAVYKHGRNSAVGDSIGIERPVVGSNDSVELLNEGAVSEAQDRHGLCFRN